MVFRRSDRERELVQEEDANGLNIVSGDDDDDEPDEDEEEDDGRDLIEEGKQTFGNLDKDIGHLCKECAASALAESYRSLGLPLMTVELPRGAMGILMPTGD